MNRRRQIRFTSQGTTSLKGRRRYRDRRTHCRLRHLSVPYTPQQSLQEIVEAVYTSQDRFSHLHSFEAEGVAEVEFEADVRGGAATLLLRLERRRAGRGLALGQAGRRPSPAARPRSGSRAGLAHRR
jgi:hypothetical protein